MGLFQIGLEVGRAHHAAHIMSTESCDAQQNSTKVYIQPINSRQWISHGGGGKKTHDIVLSVPRTRYDEQVFGQPDMQKGIRYAYNNGTGHSHVLDFNKRNSIIWKELIKFLT